METPFPKSILFVFAVFLLLPLIARATDFSSSNFKVRDPVIQIASSTEMSSASFRLTGSIGQMSIGTSTSVTFEVRSGFLYFPKVTVPAASATAGDGQVSVSWTASQGFLGWTVSGYNVGYSAAAGGPYTYTASLGNVLSTTVSGLSNGTTYYFIVRPEDTFVNSLATSSEVSATPAGSATPTPAPSGGGGGGIIIDLLKQFGYPVPEIDKIRTPSCPYPKTDLNCDGAVDLQDLSIYLYLSADPASGLIDFNSDSAADIADLSVLFSDWSRGLLTFVPDRGAGEPPKEEEKPGSGFAFIGEKPFEELEPEAGEESKPPAFFRSIILFIFWMLDWILEFFRYLFLIIIGFFARS